MAKILIVEDDEVLGRMYQKLFAYQGYQVEIAQNGLEGFKKAKAMLPDLMILDVMMPKLNGLQLLKKLKSNVSTKGITIVLLTNLGIQEELDKALKNGAIKYIIKSDNGPEKVFEMIQKLLPA